VSTAPPVARQPGDGLLRDRSGDQRVTNIELFFDLVYVFAVTQLSHYLRATLSATDRVTATSIAACAAVTVAAVAATDRRPHPA
jgi:low temperature requirement protein LtrA